MNPAATAAAVAGDYLTLLQHLLQGPPAEQAEIVSAAQHEYDTAPTPSHQLKLATHSRHPRVTRPRICPRRRGCCASCWRTRRCCCRWSGRSRRVELSQIDDHLTLETENRTLQAEAARADRERMASANHRLQTELEENARLRRELEEARAKLDAIANIERSVNERKPDSTGR